MKGRDEICKKIEEWELNIEDSVPAFYWSMYKTENGQDIREYIFGIIDALLWVIGDNSGKMI